MNTTTTTPYDVPAHTIIERVGEKLYIVTYDAAGNRYQSLDEVFINGDNELCIGLNTDNTPKYSFTSHPVTGEPVLKLGVDLHVGNNVQSKVTKTETLLITSGGSQFAAATNGVPLHVTWELQPNGKYMPVGVPATTDELDEVRVKRADFKPRK